MIPKRWKLSWIPAALVALALVGCDQTPLGTEAGLAPAEEAQYAKPTNGSGFSKVAGSIPVFTVSEEIGPEGGTIGEADFTLVVPAGAVKERAVFEFSSKNSGYMEVSLNATAVGSSDHNDVGRRGFRRPVELHFGNFHPQGGPSEWKKYRVVWVREDGVLVPVRTTIHMASKTVVGHVGHFSDYALAMP